METLKDLLKSEKANNHYEDKKKENPKKKRLT